ncbi:thioesterase II family protein [Streptomyces litchfieldiae]|uniref:Alpha/beta fold hydrolase n=1 Tax=Streptomyces litchfieldiae TaxID=3075543 RepID=A0ABU2MQM0_9ACTN|nr:alpha/beta fold hydrolase [Streptomyces sp. DSM 44938]MDT0343922.1 alpha/beta fold hydrolase [Streptomyces sp. DSM 44938]
MPVKLICLPFAGAAASFFWPWRKLGVPNVSIHPLQLAGREQRVDEEPFRDVHQAADALLPEALRVARDGHGPVAVFGHSLGAVLAYELTRRLVERGQPVAGLFVSGSPSPWENRAERATGLADDEFLKRVESLAGYRHDALNNPELRELILPALRADVEMHEQYRPRDAAPIAVDITALRGITDELVGAEELSGWSAATATDFRRVELPGGHMYLTDSGRGVLELVAATGARAGTGGR